ncbi:50S ribosomal protein L30e [uncultured archaeon]|nr:50S ribosomal protein L30e [uncultured archaeon]
MKKVSSEAVEDLRKLLAAEKLVLGTEDTLKLLRKGKLQKVVLASNCNERVKEDFSRYCEMAGVECSEIAQTSDEVGVVCRKPFAISVVGVLA